MFKIIYKKLVIVKWSYHLYTNNLLTMYSIFHTFDFLGNRQIIYIVQKIVYCIFINTTLPIPTLVVPHIFVKNNITVYSPNISLVMVVKVNSVKKIIKKDLW